MEIAGQLDLEWQKRGLAEHYVIRLPWKRQIYKS